MVGIPRPDAEAAFVAWLKAGGFAKASTRIPPTQVDGMMRVSRVGGRRLNLVQDAVEMLIEVWHSQPYEASQIAHDVAGRLESATDGTLLDLSTRVSEMNTTGPLEFPDPNSGLYRYQFTASCLLRRVGQQ